ncbi:tetratricopeptide repeat protein [Phenylobacterium montanum]|uniref:Tetratricopeptide repeat protein n=1 Tax=Phenylobacterium montanum TaxID=2823693 RepID=A0A975FX89_9CAUL|nr:tetratricopeptide repeat protein [Caulobacter sp. S6]QUD86826.1 tetratricopeptide repeat protein [Caulobacter sp. S6]
MNALLSGDSMNRRVFGATGLVCLFLAGAVAAQTTRENWIRCENADNAPVAVAACDEILRQRLAPSDRVIALTDRGASYLNEGRVNLAINDFDEALVLNPQYLEALINRAGALMHQGDRARAANDYSAIVAINSHFFSAEDFLSRGIAHEHLGQFDLAIEDYSSAIQRRPKISHTLYGAYLMRGSAYAHTGSPELAIADYNQANKIEPDDAEIYLYRGQAYGQAKDFSHAIADIDQALVQRPNWNAALTAGCRFRAIVNRDLDAAANYCDLAVRRSGGSIIDLDSRGLVRLQQHRFSEAWTDFDAVVRVQPAAAHSLYGRGLAALRLGRMAEGQADIAAAAKLDAKIADTYSAYGQRP